jgi:hypothetical protein
LDSDRGANFIKRSSTCLVVLFLARSISNA